MRCERRGAAPGGPVLRRPEVPSALARPCDLPQPSDNEEDLAGSTINRLSPSALTAEPHSPHYDSMAPSENPFAPAPPSDFNGKYTSATATPTPVPPQPPTPREAHRGV
nr:uncharacterized protein LOC113812962 [Penaeus vannamei]